MSATKDPIALGDASNWNALYNLGHEQWNNWTKSVIERKIDKEWIIAFDSTFHQKNFENFEFPPKTSFKLISGSSPLICANTVFHGDITFRGTGLELSSFSGAHFKGKAIFEKNNFNKRNNFSKAIFEDDALFKDAQFTQAAQFRGAEFRGDADFRGITFNSTADFSNCCFSQEVNFELAVFLSMPIFTRSKFIRTVPNFRATHFASQYPPDFHGARFTYPKNSTSSAWDKLRKICAQPDGSERMRVLKRLAANGHNHDEELKFFAMEMLAKRKHEIPYNKISNWPRLGVSHAYELCSDFGRSIVRPVIGLILTALISTYFYASLSSNTDSTELAKILNWESGVIAASLSSLLPFAGQTVIGRTVMQEVLCPSKQKPETLDIECLSELYLISTFEGIFAFIFLFLLGISLRNIARIK